jgi:hypothetical protein
MYLPPPISKPVHDIEMEKAIKKGASQVMTSPFGIYMTVLLVVTVALARSAYAFPCVPAKNHMAICVV